MTQTGTIVGTAKYLAPEQVEGHEPDGRSDIYALGVDALRDAVRAGARSAVTPSWRRRWPTSAATPPRRGASGQGYPLHSRPPSCHAMARDPDDRPPTAAAFRAELTDVDLGPDDATSLIARDPTPPAGNDMPIDPRARRAAVSVPPGAAGRCWSSSVIVAVGVLLGLLFSRSGPSTSSSKAPPPAAGAGRTISSVKPFDPPPGDGTEHDELAALAIDGDPSTFWETSHYNGPHFGGLKPGRRTDPSAQRADRTCASCTSPRAPTGWSADVYVASSPGGGPRRLGVRRGDAIGDPGRRHVRPRTPHWRGGAAVDHRSGPRFPRPDQRGVAHRLIGRARRSPRTDRAPRRPGRLSLRSDHRRDRGCRARCPAVGGDRGALDTLLRRHHDRVYALCRRMAGNDADGADATQEALIAIVRGLPRFDGRSRFTTWAAPRRCQRLPRRAPAAPASAAADPRRRPVDCRRASDGTAEVADRARHRRGPRPSPARVPRRRRAPRPVPLDYAEIAEILDMPVGTVRSRIARGRAPSSRSSTRPGTPTAPHVQLPRAHDRPPTPTTTTSPPASTARPPMTRSPRGLVPALRPPPPKSSAPSAPPSDSRRRHVGRARAAGLAAAMAAGVAGAGRHPRAATTPRTRVAHSTPVARVGRPAGRAGRRGSRPPPGPRRPRRRATAPPRPERVAGRSHRRRSPSSTPGDAAPARAAASSARRQRPLRPRLAGGGRRSRRAVRRPRRRALAASPTRAAPAAGGPRRARRRRPFAAAAAPAAPCASAVPAGAAPRRTGLGAAEGRPARRVAAGRGGDRCRFVVTPSATATAAPLAQP